MALTITREPSNEIESAYTQATVFELTSDRDGSEAESVTSIADNGAGKCEYTVASHSYVIGDVLTGSGFSEATYNVKQTVTDTTATTIDTDIDFVATATGTLTLTNSSFQVSGKIGIQGVNASESISDVFSGGTIDGKAIIVLDNALAAADVNVGDLIKVTNVTNIDGIHEVQSVSGSATSEISIYMPLGTSIVDTTGDIELLGKINNEYPEKFVSAIDTGSGDVYRLGFGGVLESILENDIADLGSSNILNATGGVAFPAFLFSEWHDRADGTRIQRLFAEHDATEFNDTLKDTRETQEITEYYLDTSFGLFMSDVPNNTLIQEDEEIQLSFLSPIETDIQVEYITYDLSGAANPNATLGAVVLTSNKAIIPINDSNILSDTISKFDVWIRRTSDNARISEIKTFIMDFNCYQDDRRIWWHNKRGGYDSYTFTVGGTDGQDVDQDTYRKPLPLDFGADDRGQSVAKSVAVKTFTANSVQLPKNSKLWISQIAYSDDVRVEEDGELVPIIVDGFSEIINSTRTLEGINIEYRYANEEPTHLG